MIFNYIALHKNSKDIAINNSWVLDAIRTVR